MYKKEVVTYFAEVIFPRQNRIRHTVI